MADEDTSKPTEPAAPQRPVGRPLSESETDAIADAEPDDDDIEDARRLWDSVAGDLAGLLDARPADPGTG